MPRPCASCESPFARELDRQIRADVPLTVLSAWASSQGHAISRNALSRHRRDHVGMVTGPGRKGMSDDLATAIRDRVHERLAEGDIQPGVRDGLSAQALLDRREATAGDREWQAKLVLALGGHAPFLRVIDPEREALEAEFRPLLEAGGH